MLIGLMLTSLEAIRETAIHIATLLLSEATLFS
jgi:hypothetical protein